MEEYEARGRAVETVKGLRSELDRLGSWLKKRRPKPKLEEVDAALVQRYLGERGAFKSKATVSGVMSKLRGWGEFLAGEGHWQSSPLRWMRGPKLDSRSRVPRRIGRESMTRLWQEAATTRYGFHRSLWVTILAVLYGTGARRGEVHRLNVEHWDREQGILVFDGRKTAYQHHVPVPALVARALEGYLPKRQNHLESLGRRDEPALFVDRYGGRLACHAISRGIRRIARRGDLSELTLHQFRHTCASDLLEDGARLPEVQQVLGHRTISTTMRYLSIADPQLHRAVALHPVNDFLSKGGS